MLATVGTNTFQLLIPFSNTAGTIPKTLNVGFLVKDPGVNQYRVTNVIRIYGAAQSIASFATSPSYLSSLGIANANSIWDGVSNWAGLSGANSVAPSYGIQSAATTLVAGTTVTSLIIAATHTDTGTLVQANSGKS